MSKKEGSVRVGGFLVAGNGREYSSEVISDAVKRFKDPGLIAEGIDALTQTKTYLRKEKLVADVTGRPQPTRDVFVVHSGAVSVGDGLYFVTQTIAEVHFDNITGKHGREDSEPSGGRTLQEMVDHLFHS